MKNPINNNVFDSRDLIEYRDFLATELTDNWNSMEGAENHQADDINEVLGTDAYEYADDIKEVFAEFENSYSNEIDEYNAIITFCDDLSGSSDFEYGESIIHENYFTDFTEELLKDCGYIPADFPSWIELDFEATAENVKADYSEATYLGDTYYIRA